MNHTIIKKENLYYDLYLIIIFNFINIIIQMKKMRIEVKCDLP